MCPSVCFCLFGLTQILSKAEAPRFPDAESLKVTAKVVGAPPLPYQAVRIRVTVENVSKHPIFVMAPEDALRVDGIKLGAEKLFDARRIDILSRVEIDGKRGLGIACGPLGPNRHELLELKPGERRSVTFAVSVHRGDLTRPPHEWPTIPVPLFTAPGAHDIRIRYMFGTLPADKRPAAEQAITATARVDVAKPAPVDVVWMDALPKSGELTALLLRPHAACTAEQAIELRKMLTTSPDSSFADYARFAVARYHIDGGDVPRHSWRVNWAFAADELEKIDSKRASGGFPFRPHVVHHWMQAEPHQKERLTESLNNDLRDSIEWIDATAPHLGPSGWKLFRKFGPLSLDEWTQIRRSKPDTFLFVPGLDPSEFSLPRR